MSALYFMVNFIPPQPKIRQRCGKIQRLKQHRHSSIIDVKCANTPFASLSLSIPHTAIIFPSMLRLSAVNFSDKYLAA